MKVLMIFVDMLRPNLLSIGNRNIKDTPLDWVLKSWNGTFYSNCFTPAPDTPRSTACLWSSRYPIYNECNTRIRYPKFYLKNPEENFLRLIENSGYKLNFVVNQVNIDLGELPCDFEHAVYYSVGLLEERMRRVEITDNSFTYINIQDYHNVVSDWDARSQAITIGNKMIADELKLIERTLPFCEFDYIILYSDHGWKISGESMGNPIQQLGRNRTQVMLYIVPKGQEIFKTDKRLSSIMDIGPTVCDMLNIEIPYDTDGLSLLSNKKNKWILIEDHLDFNVTFGQTIEMWGVRSDKGLACCSTDGIVKADYETSDQERAELFEFISEKGSFFKENYFQQKILDKYKAVETQPYYYDGTLRKEHISVKKRAGRAVRNYLLR